MIVWFSYILLYFIETHSMFTVRYSLSTRTKIIVRWPTDPKFRLRRKWQTSKPCSASMQQLRTLNVKPPETWNPDNRMESYRRNPFLGFSSRPCWISGVYKKLHIGYDRPTERFFRGTGTVPKFGLSLKLEKYQLNPSNLLIWVK